MYKLIYMAAVLVVIICISIIAWMSDASLIHPPGSSIGGHVWQLWTIRVVSSVAALVGGFHILRAFRSQLLRRSSSQTRHRLDTMLSKTSWSRTVKIETNSSYEIVVSARTNTAINFDIRCTLIDAVTGATVDTGRIKKTTWIDETECEMRDFGEMFRTRHLIVKSDETVADEVAITLGECTGLAKN